jgi:hypothetical protein
MRHSRPSGCSGHCSARCRASLTANQRSINSSVTISETLVKTAVPKGFRETLLCFNNLSLSRTQKAPKPRRSLWTSTTKRRCAPGDCGVTKMLNLEIVVSAPAECFVNRENESGHFFHPVSSFISNRTGTSTNCRLVWSLTSNRTSISRPPCTTSTNRTVTSEEDFGQTNKNATLKTAIAVTATRPTCCWRMSITTANR